MSTVNGTSIDSERARQQQEDALVCALRDLSVNVLELPPKEESLASVFTDNCAVAVNGIALSAARGTDAGRSDAGCYA